jgi:hypothetical protein
VILASFAKRKPSLISEAIYKGRGLLSIAICMSSSRELEHQRLKGMLKNPGPLSIVEASE